MSCKGRGGTNVNYSVKGRRRSTIILESSPSAEIASYDYETTLSQPELDQSYAKEKQVETLSPRENYSEEKIEETSPRDHRIDRSPRNVSFSTDNRISEKLTSATKSTNQNIKQIIEPVACENIVNESGDEGEHIDVCTVEAKELPKNPVATIHSKVKKRTGYVSSTRREKNGRNVPRVKTSLKELTKRKIINSSLLDGHKNSRIPRATTITCAVAQMYQAPITKIHDILKPVKGSTESLVDDKLKNLKAPRINSEKGKSADAKKKLQLYKESPRTQLASAAGDHPSPSLPSSLRKNSRLRNPCRSCNDRRETVNLKLSIHDVRDPWSDSKSSPVIRFPNHWSKAQEMNPFIDSTSEEIDMSSEYSSDGIKPTMKKYFIEKTSTKSPISKAGYTRTSPRLRPRRRAHFSFFNTLFDIIFWPFLFLRTNR